MGGQSNRIMICIRIIIIITTTMMSFCVGHFLYEHVLEGYDVIRMEAKLFSWAAQAKFMKQ